MRPLDWLPLVATVGSLLAVPVAVDTLVSPAWGELSGLALLLASPAIYRLFVGGIDTIRPGGIPGIAATD